MASLRTSWDLQRTLLAAEMERHRRRGRPVLDLTESNPTRIGLPYPAEEIRAALSPPEVLRYEPSPRGLSEARQAVADHLALQGLPASPDRLLLTASTSEAYSFLFKLLCDPGDEVLVPTPSYPLFDFLTRLDGVVPRPYRLRWTGRWSIDLDSLEANLSPRSRAILIVHPNNPTGSYLGRGQAESLRALAADRNLAVLSDEVFLDYPLTDDPDRLPSVGLLEDVSVFVLGGLSKTALLPQVKLAWIRVGGPDAEEHLQRLEVISDTYLSASASAQRGAGPLLALTAPLRQALLHRIRDNLALLRDRCGDVSLLEPDGGWYAVLRGSTRTDDAWAARLLAETDVHVHPGAFYDFGWHDAVVVSLLPPPEVFGEALDRLLTAL